MQKTKSVRWISTDKKVLVWIFLLFTLIAGLQFLQYFIAYNSSYPFPWQWNLGLTFGTFYSYFLFVPGIFWSSRKLKSMQLPIGRWVMAHLLLALVIALAHLSLINVIEWWQVKSWSESDYGQLYRWKIARYLHLEILMYAFITGIWYVVQLLRWRKVSKGEPTGKLEINDPKLTRLRIKNGSDVSYVPVEEIRWLEAYDNYVKCFVNSGYLMVRSTLSGLEKDLDSEQFLRTHRSCIVAIKEVQKIRNQEGKHLAVLLDGTELKLSKTYKKSLESRLKAPSGH